MMTDDARRRKVIERILHQYFEAMYFAKTKRQDDRITAQFVQRIIRGR